ncbi:hypothetical protein IJL65_03180 [bacterium]|nr:hypothetical protein [bacterium]
MVDTEMKESGGGYRRNLKISEKTKNKGTDLYFFSKTFLPGMGLEPTRP